MDVLPPTPAQYSSIGCRSSITFVVPGSTIRIKMCGVPREAGVKKINAGKSSKSASKSAGKTRVSKRTAVDTQTIADLVAANRILYAQSVLDGYGHVSARHDLRPDHFWLSRGLAPGLVTDGDSIAVD